MSPRTQLVRSKPFLAFVVLFMVGCLLGIFSVSRSSPSSSVRGLSTLEYPAGWRPVSYSVALPGLRFLHPLALAPDGSPANAGLVVGLLAGSRQSPLPESLLADLPSAPRGEVVEALGGQEYYRYRWSDGDAVELYVEPSAGENASVLACYASGRALARLRECRQIVASATEPSVVDEDLTPDRGFASALAAALASFERGRQQQRARLADASSAAGLAEAAGALGRIAMGAGETVAALAWPSPLARMRSSLDGALRGAALDYSALARAATRSDAPAYDAARLRVMDDERQIDDDLAGMVIYGYS
jgi:hypothetical protein